MASIVSSSRRSVVSPAAFPSLSLFCPFETPQAYVVVLPPHKILETEKPLDSRMTRLKHLDLPVSIAGRELFSPKHLQHLQNGVFPGAFPRVRLAPFIPPTACGSGL